MANFTFSSNLRLITHLAKTMDSWAAAFVFQMEQSSLPWAIPGWKGRTHVSWAPRNQSHVDAHASFQGSQCEMLDAITDSRATKMGLTFYKLFAWVRAGTPVQERDG